MAKLVDDEVEYEKRSKEYNTLKVAFVVVFLVFLGSVVFTFTVLS